MRGHTHAFRRFAVVLIVLLLVASPVAAQAIWTYTGNSEPTQDRSYGLFYDGDTDSYYSADRNNQNVYEFDGDWNLVETHNVGTTWATGVHKLDNGSFVVTSDFNHAIAIVNDTWDVQNTFTPSEIGVTATGVEIDESGDIYVLNSTDVTVFDSDWNFQTSHSISSEVSQGADIALFNDQFYITDSTNNDVTVYDTSFNPTGTVHDVDNETDNAGGIAKNLETGNWWVSDESTLATAFEYFGESPSDLQTETNLELEIDRWMPFDSEQRYEVYLNETNTTTGYTNLTDVTEDANVTVYNITNTTGFNEPIVTVNNTSDTLQSYNQTGVVAVNATWENQTLGNATNLTVGNRNLTNIGIMPPSQWIPSFFEIDDAAGDHGIGSSMQWILFIIVVMAAGTRMVENPWVGVGGGMLTSILIWVLGYVDLGIVLATVFAGLLVAVIMTRTGMGRGVARDNEYSGIASRKK